MTDAEINAIINRRAAVETILLDMAAGNRPLPDADGCRALAEQLGVPDEFRTPEFRARRQQWHLECAEALTQPSRSSSEVRNEK